MTDHVIDNFLLDTKLGLASSDIRKGVELVQSVLTLPLARIAFNAGAEPNDVVSKVSAMTGNHGYNAPPAGSRTWKG